MTKDLTASASRFNRELVRRVQGKIIKPNRLIDGATKIAPPLKETLKLLSVPEEDLPKLPGANSDSKTAMLKSDDLGEIVLNIGDDRISHYNHGPAEKHSKYPLIVHDLMDHEILPIDGEKLGRSPFEELLHGFTRDWHDKFAAILSPFDSRQIFTIFLDAAKRELIKLTDGSLPEEFLVNVLGDLSPEIALLDYCLLIVFNNPKPAFKWKEMGVRENAKTKVRVDLGKITVTGKIPREKYPLFIKRRIKDLELTGFKKANESKLYIAEPGQGTNKSPYQEYLSVEHEDGDTRFVYGALEDFDPKEYDLELTGHPYKAKSVEGIFFGDDCGNDLVSLKEEEIDELDFDRVFNQDIPDEDVVKVDCDSKYLPAKRLIAKFALAFNLFQKKLARLLTEDGVSVSTYNNDHFNAKNWAELMQQARNENINEYRKILPNFNWEKIMPAPLNFEEE